MDYRFVLWEQLIRKYGKICIHQFLRRGSLSIRLSILCNILVLFHLMYEDMGPIRHKFYARIAREENVVTVSFFFLYIVINIII